MKIPVYLCECHEWSDGEDDHIEDHNSFYDIKYFIIKNEPDVRVICVWSAHDYMPPFEAGLMMGKQELSEKDQVVDEIDVDVAWRLVNKATRINLADSHSASDEMEKAVEEWRASIVQKPLVFKTHW